MPERLVSVLGGMTVIAQVSFGVTEDPSNGVDYWATVDGLWWVKRDGTKGAALSEAMMDKVERHDPYMARIVEQVSEALAYEAWEARKEAGEPEMVRLFDEPQP